MVVFLVLVGSGAAQATWTALSTAMSAQVATGTPGVTLDASPLNRTYGFTTGSSSSVAVSSMTIINSGTTPLTSYALTSSTSNATYGGKISLWFWSPTAGSCGSTAVGTPGTLAVPPPLPVAATVGGTVGSVITVCAATQLTTSVILTAAQTVTTTLTITAKIGDNWQATSSSGVKQSSILPDVTLLPCQNAGVLPGILLSGATISWTLPAGATAATVYNGASVVGSRATTSTSMTLDALGFGVGGATSVRIVAVYAGGVESAGVSQPLTPLLGGLGGTSCG
jgi:hypothetical protein